MNSRDRPRGLPSNVSPTRERRPMAGVRNGSNTNPAPTGMSRAERFDDEKRRLIQCCFGKQDVDGSGGLPYIGIDRRILVVMQRIGSICNGSKHLTDNAYGTYLKDTALPEKIFTFYWSNFLLLTRRFK